MENNDFKKVLNLLDKYKTLTLEQIKVLQKIIDSDARELERKFEYPEGMDENQ